MVDAKVSVNELGTVLGSVHAITAVLAVLSTVIQLDRSGSEVMVYEAV